MRAVRQSRKCPNVWTFAKRAREAPAAVRVTAISAVSTKPGFEIRPSGAVRTAFTNPVHEKPAFEMRPFAAVKRQTSSLISGQKRRREWIPPRGKNAVAVTETPNRKRREVLPRFRLFVAAPVLRAGLSGGISRFGIGKSATVPFLPVPSPNFRISNAKTPAAVTPFLFPEQIRVSASTRKVQISFRCPVD